MTADEANKAANKFRNDFIATQVSDIEADIQDACEAGLFKLRVSMGRFADDIILQLASSGFTVAAMDSPNKNEYLISWDITK